MLKNRVQSRYASTYNHKFSPQHPCQVGWAESQKLSQVTRGASRAKDELVSGFPQA